MRESWLVRCLTGITKYFSQLDKELYKLGQLFQGLTKRQRQLIICLAVVCAIFLLSFINAQVENNAVWLEGTWAHRSEQYAIQAKNKTCRSWDVKQNGYILMRDAQIATNSSVKRIVLARSGSNTEYHILKLDKEHLIIQIFNNQKKIKEMKLHKIK